MAQEVALAISEHVALTAAEQVIIVDCETGETEVV